MKKNNSLFQCKCTLSS